MAAKPCPSCQKQNCGNHAACARRKANECKRCKRSPCYDLVRCEAWDALWTVVGTIEPILQNAIKKNGLIAYEDLDAETLCAMRWEIFHMMDQRIRREEHEKNMKALGQMMLRGWR